MRRKALIVLLALGTIGGFGSGIMSMAHGHCARRDAFERHVAQVCVDAAARSRGEHHDHDHHEHHQRPPSDRY